MSGGVKSETAEKNNGSETLQEHTDTFFSSSYSYGEDYYFPAPFAVPGSARPQPLNLAPLSRVKKEEGSKCVTARQDVTECLRVMHAASQPPLSCLILPCVTRLVGKDNDKGEGIDTWLQYTHLPPAEPITPPGRGRQRRQGDIRASALP